MLKILSRILGGLLIGFGLGILLTQSVSLSHGQYLIILILSLVLGGFFLAVDWRRKEKKEEVRTSSESSSPSSESWRDGQDQALDESGK